MNKIQLQMTKLIKEIAKMIKTQQKIRIFQESDFNCKQF